MKHKVKRIHFVGSERTQSRSLLPIAVARPLAAPANTDEGSHEA
jgi:hypothetical protein